MGCEGGVIRDKLFCKVNGRLSSSALVLPFNVTTLLDSYT